MTVNSHSLQKQFTFTIWHYRTIIYKENLRLQLTLQLQSKITIDTVVDKNTIAVCG
jgi:hypothetical protein